MQTCNFWTERRQVRCLQKSPPPFIPPPVECYSRLEYARLRELHEQRCGGKCAKSKDGKIVVETQEAQSEACQYRYFAWDWQRQTCRMSDNAMLNEDAQLYLTLHLDTAVYKAQKYTQNCKGGIVPTNFKRRCQRRMQQIGHALMFIPKAKDKVGQPLTTEQQRKIKYVQTAIGGEDAKYARCSNDQPRRRKGIRCSPPKTLYTWLFV